MHPALFFANQMVTHQPPKQHDRIRSPEAEDSLLVVADEHFNRFYVEVDVLNSLLSHLLRLGQHFHSSRELFFNRENSSATRLYLLVAKEILRYFSRSVFI